MSGSVDRRGFISALATATVAAGELFGFRRASASWPVVPDG
jgi:hypothetical protein